MGEQMTLDKPPSRGCGPLGAIGCLAILAILALLTVGAAVVGGFVERFLASPEEVVADYVSAIREDDIAAAHELLCDEIRGATSQRELGRQVAEQLEGLGPIQRTEHVLTMPRLDRMSVYWRLRGTVRSREIEFSMVRDLDAWRICGFDWPRG